MMDGLADRETGMVHDRAFRGADVAALVEAATANDKGLTTEMQVGTDDALALMLTGRSMHDLILAAVTEDDALIAAVQINPRVIDVESIDACFRRPVKA